MEEGEEIHIDYRQKTISDRNLEIIDRVRIVNSV